MESALSRMSEYIPAEIHTVAALQFCIIFCAAAIAVSFLIKLLLGEGSDLNHAISSVMAILCIYAATIVIRTFSPMDLANYLSPLPFVLLSGDYIMILPITKDFLPEVSGQILSIIILAFLVNISDSFVPAGKSPIGWLISKAISVVLAMALHYLTIFMLDAFLPGVVTAYAPIILLAILVITFLVGVLNPILTAVLCIFSPIVGALYHFFFVTFVGKQLTKALLTGAILCGLVYLLEQAGYTVICISTAALSAYIPLLAAFLLLWYFIEKKL